MQQYKIAKVKMIMSRYNFLNSQVLIFQILQHKLARGQLPENGDQQSNETN